jgi:anti-anti-sigma regulatory factor
MKVKIDTKEKMHVITIEENNLAANMTEEIKEALLKYLKEPVSNLIVDFRNVAQMQLEAAQTLAFIQQKFYEENHSMVFCNLQTEITGFLDENDLLEILNVTPTESEAWDIVQMEEIEREFL